MDVLQQPTRSFEDRGPLRTMFMLTSMPVGGAETLLVNLIRRLDREIVLPEVCCLKSKGPLGEQLSAEIPVHANLIRYKTDVLVLRRLVELIQTRRLDAVVTVGAGDKMFWGRIAAWWAKVPVIASALHSTGWPDGIGRLNRRLTSITDGFIAVAESHGRYLVEQEKLPRRKVFVIPNGVDTNRFCPAASDRQQLRTELRLPGSAKIVAIVAALRPEKNHARFLRIAAAVLRCTGNVEFLIVGDGPQRGALESLANSLGIAKQVHFLGPRCDIPRILAATDLFLLTSDNEASPVSVMEAMACGVPVVASDVGSINEMVIDGETGFCVRKFDEPAFTAQVVALLADEAARKRMGQRARDRVARCGSLDAMVRGYEELLVTLYTSKIDKVACRRADPYEKSEQSSKLVT